jgi:hypothetical protein
MMKKTGGANKTMHTMKNATLALATVAMLGVAAPALAANGGAGKADAPHAQNGPRAADLFKGFALAAIEVMKEAAQATSDTVHHNLGNAMGTAAKARGFVRDGVSGVLGNARKITGMVGDVMPLTTHNHYQNAAQAKKDNKAK